MAKKQCFIGAKFDEHALPLLELLDTNPKIKYHLYFDGKLLDLWQEKDDQLKKIIQKLVKRGQIEILATGHYNPLLSLIPEEDRLGQLELNIHSIKKLLNVTPVGVYLSGRDWDPSFPKLMSLANIEYCVLDEYYFDKNTPGYYLTEEGGAILRLIPAFDFSRKVEKDAETMLISQYLEENDPIGSIYVPTASIRDGYLKAAIAANPKLNEIHKKIAYLSNKLSSLKKGKFLFGTMEKDVRLKNASLWLYRAEGLFNFNNLSIDHMRQAIFANLIKAEREIDKFSHAERPFCDLALTDINKDGKDEVILSNNLINVFISPQQGGAVFDVDYKPKAVNLFNTFHRTGALVDHFLAQPGNKHSCQEAGNFINAKYLYMPRRKGQETGVLLSYEGLVDGLKVNLEKYISIFNNQSLVHIEYMLANDSGQEDEFWFGIEFAFNFNTSAKSDIFKIETIDEEKQINSISVKNQAEALAVALEFDKPAQVWLIPIEDESHLKEHTKVVFPYWKFRLSPGQGWRLKLTLCVQE